jgi:hypothetical protein
MEKVFEQIVAFADRTGNSKPLISQEEFDQWREDFIWEALHGQRYGQSFCNRFGLHDNHLYYNTGGVDWADEYIRKTYIDRS